MLRKSARYDDAFKHFAVGTAANRVGGDQPDALRLVRFDLRAGFFKPVGHQIGTAWDTASIDEIEPVEIIGAEFPTLFAASEKGWIADDCVDSGSSRLV